MFYDMNAQWSEWTALGLKRVESFSLKKTKYGKCFAVQLSSQKLKVMYSANTKLCILLAWIGVRAFPTE
jgi:hypothetical protein